MELVLSATFVGSSSGGETTPDGKKISLLERKTSCALNLEGSFELELLQCSGSEDPKPHTLKPNGRIFLTPQRGWTQCLVGLMFGSREDCPCPTSCEDLEKNTFLLRSSIVHRCGGKLLGPASSLSVCCSAGNPTTMLVF